MNRRELCEFLFAFLGREINLFIDNEAISENINNLIIGESIKLQSDTGNSLLIEAVDIPHFYGEGELEFYETEPTPVLLSNPYSIVPKKIKVLGYKPKGINLFSTPNLIQLDFIESDSKSISLGFFALNPKANFLSTQELCCNFNNLLSNIQEKRIVTIFEIKGNNR